VSHQEQIAWEGWQMAGGMGRAETPLQVIGGMSGLALLCWAIWSCVGCGKNGDPQQPSAPQKSNFDLEPPISETPDDFGPLTDARERVKRFEKKRAALQPLLDKAQADRDELVGKLREAGVEKKADLKGNSRGQQFAVSLQRLTVEIDGLDRSLAALDSAITEAQSVVRRLERERAGIGDEEMRKLAEQLREVEERTDGTPLPVTPLDVDSALEKALKATPKPSEKTKTTPTSERPVPMPATESPSNTITLKGGRSGYADVPATLERGEKSWVFHVRGFIEPNSAINQARAIAMNEMSARRRDDFKVQTKPTSTGTDITVYYTGK
jgi:hypothetical protein